VQPQQIKLVKSTWKQVLPIAEQMFEMFYGRLVSLDPELNRLFTTDMTTQGRQWMAMLRRVVCKLDQFDEIAPAVREAGRQFPQYGIKNRDYDTVRDALLWTLSKGLDEEFTDVARKAWVEFYNLIAKNMKTAAMRAA
jgi:hemoglobin-like flavoprotein